MTNRGGRWPFYVLPLAPRGDARVTLPKPHKGLLFAPASPAQTSRCGAYQRETMKQRCVDDWCTLSGVNVEIRQQGSVVSGGTVETVTEDGKILWLLFARAACARYIAGPAAQTRAVPITPGHREERERRIDGGILALIVRRTLGGPGDRGLRTPTSLVPSSKWLLPC